MSILQNEKNYQVKPAISYCGNYKFSSNVLGFKNEEIKENMIFFVKPPMELGNITNVTSTFFLIQLFIIKRRF